MMMRFGIVAGALSVFTCLLLTAAPMDARASSTWLSLYEYMALAIFAVIVLYAFRTSLGGRPLLGAPKFED
jgi:hypothetical protein